MIDTLFLRLNKFEVKKGADLQVKQPSISNKTGEVKGDFVLWNEDGRGEVRGVGAYYNSDDFNVDVNGWGFLVHTSIPKLFNPLTNFFPLEKKEQMKDAIGKLQVRLEEKVGIVTDLLDATPTRVDLFKNAVLEHPTSNYFPVLQSIGEGRRVKLRDYGDSVLFYNTQRQVCCYDKIVEMRAKAKKEKKILNVSRFPRNVMRTELRFLNKKVVLKETGDNTLGGLLEGWEDLPKVYEKQIKRVLFSGWSSNIPSLAGDEEFMQQLKSKAKRRQWSYVKGMLGMRYLAERYKVHEFQRLITNVFSRRVAALAVDDFREMQLALNLFGTREVETKDLYNELYSKLVA
jgi:hypothetical protein